MKNQPSIDDLTEGDWTNLGDMISGLTRYEIDYFEESFRVLQCDPRFCGQKEQEKLIQTRDTLSIQLNKWKKREDDFSNMTSKYRLQIYDTLFPKEVDSIVHNNLELYYQIKELLETVIRFDIELIVDRITHGKPVVRNLLELEHLISQASKYKIDYLQPEIKIMRKYMQNKH